MTFDDLVQDKYRLTTSFRHKNYTGKFGYSLLKEYERRSSYTYQEVSSLGAFFHFSPGREGWRERRTFTRKIDFSRLKSTQRIRL